MNIYPFQETTGSNIFLMEEQRIMVVNAGASGSAPRVLEYVEVLGGQLEKIGLILLTHGRPDQSGGVRGIQASSGA